MATNPFVAGEDPTGDLPDANTFSKLQDQWNTFLDKPEGRAALLSFGINMLQPPSFGDNPLSQAGRAIGAAGQTLSNIEKMDIVQQEAASKEAAREAAANLAEARAGQAGLTGQLGQERLAAQREAIQARQETSRLSASLQLQKMYQTEKQKFEADFINNPQRVPFQNYSEWLISDPIARETAARAGINVDLAPSRAAPTTGLNPLDQQALDWANAHPDDPKAAVIHKKLGR